MQRHDERALRAANEVYRRGPPQLGRLAALLAALGCALALVLAAGLAHGQEAAGGEGGVPGTRSLVVDGVAGVWFPAATARRMLADLEELPLLRERVGLLEQRLALRDDQTERLRRIVDLTEQAEARAVAALERAEAARQAAVERSTVWWRSPALWLAVGVVVAGALVALTAYGLSAAGGG